MRAKEILEITKGKLVSGSPDTNIDPARISTDSRTIRRGGFFIALNGLNFDGNDYVYAAFKKGAKGALVTRPVMESKRLIIQAKDATQALQDIAHYHRMKFDIPVIGVTGSNGKTTTKEMIWSVLSSKYNVLKNEGTKNNHVGVPQTLLKLNSGHDICVLEIGMNHKGEIGVLSGVARPTIALIMNIGPSHLEFLGGLKSVFEAKKEMLKYFHRRGLIMLNGDDKYLSRINSGDFNIARFGFQKGNDFRATDVVREMNRLRFRLNGKAKFTLNLLGAHNIYNALAAIAVASQFDISYGAMKKALLSYKPASMRLNLRKIGGLDIIDDSYNSNPLSMECALESLERFPAAAKWVVSGDMLELGKNSRAFHRNLGEIIAKARVSGLLTLGDLSKTTLSRAMACGLNKDNLYHCSDHNEVVKILRRITEIGDAVLIKGSRAMKMEKIIEKLRVKGKG